jgi:hypothetical protein
VGELAYPPLETQARCLELESPCVSVGQRMLHLSGQGGVGAAHIELVLDALQQRGEIVTHALA